MKSTIQKAFFAITLATFAIACSKEQTPEPSAQQQVSVLDEKTENISSKSILANARLTASVKVTDACGTSTNVGNCVLFARCKKSSLPFGLTTYAQKKAIINTQNAVVGAVAIVNVGNTTGHVAYVRAVSGTTITLREANWAGQYISERSGTKAELSIVGYFN
jgi:surface antigen